MQHVGDGDALAGQRSEHRSRRGRGPLEDGGEQASEPMIGYARDTAVDASCRFETGLARQLPCDDGEFDVVLSCLMPHHLPDTDRAAALGDMRRVLRPGGRLPLADFRPPRSGLTRRLLGLFSGRSPSRTPETWACSTTFAR